jgi:hypothetical protein
MAPTGQGSAQQSTKPNACCSFCRKSVGEAGPLVEGPDTGAGNVYICRNCVKLVMEIFDNEDRARRA